MSRLAWPIAWAARFRANVALRSYQQTSSTTVQQLWITSSTLPVHRRNEDGPPRRSCGAQRSEHSGIAPVQRATAGTGLCAQAGPDVVGPSHQPGLKAIGRCRTRIRPGLWIRAMFTDINRIRLPPG